MNLQLQTSGMQTRRPLFKLISTGSSAWRSSSLGDQACLSAVAGLASARHSGAATCHTQQKNAHDTLPMTSLGLQRHLSSSSSRVVICAASAEDTAENSSELNKAIEEAQVATSAGEHAAPRNLNPEPVHPGAVMPETVLLQGEDHTEAFAGIDPRAQSLKEDLGPQQRDDEGVFDHNQQGVSEPGAAEMSSSEGESDFETPDPSRDASAATFLEEADLPLKGAPPMDQLSDPGILSLWLDLRR